MFSEPLFKATACECANCEIMRRPTNYVSSPERVSTRGAKNGRRVSGMEAGPRSLGVKALYCLVSGFVFEISDQASFLKPTLPTL